MREKRLNKTLDRSQKPTKMIAMDRESIKAEIESIFANATRLKHLDDDESFRLGEAVSNALTSLEASELSDLIDQLNNLIREEA